MVELRGSLNGIGLSAIVQLIGELRHTGSLELTKGPTRGVLDFDDGRLVAADFAADSGLTALAKLSLELSDGEFTFTEGAPLHERTLDLGAKDVQGYLRRVASGEEFAEAAAPPPVEHDEPQSLGTCPMLGFADDRARHYSRPTALHRCYATGASSLVTGQEQRELCLGGRYPTCPRFRNGSPSNGVTIAALAESPAPAPAETLPPPIELPLMSPPPPAQTMSPRPVPAGVAARMAVASHMRLDDSTHSTADVPTGVGHDRSGPAKSSDADSPTPGLSGRLRRALLLVGTGVVAGLLLLVGVVLVSMPALNGGLTAQQPTVAGTQAFAPVPTATRAPAFATSTALPPARPTPTVAVVAARPPTPTAVRPSTVAAAGQPLLDVRFVSGAGKGWLDSPPVAAWSDGAFRLQARQSTRFVAVSAPIDELLSDVVVSGTFRKTGGPPGGGYGLVVRDQGPGPRNGVNQTMNAYVLEVGDLGEFGIWRRDGDHWVDLVPWTRSSSVRPGGSPNDLAARALGSRFTFTINGTEVASAEDDTFVAGGVGVFIGGDYNEVALDRFTVQVAD